MNRLRAFRMDRNLSQYELAEATRGAVPRWKIQLAELGHSSLEQSERESIAAALGVSVERLFPLSSDIKDLSQALPGGNDAS